MLSGDEGIEIAVGVHVHEADVVGGLVVVPMMWVVNLPFPSFSNHAAFAADVGAGGGVGVAVAVDVADLKAVGRHEIGVDVMDFPLGVFVPNEAGAVAATGDDVELSVAVYVGGHYVRGTGMLAGKSVFFKWLRRIPCRPPTTRTIRPRRICLANGRPWRRG